MNTVPSLVTITTLTPTRMGMGQAVGLIDLPIHREVSTNWPLLSGSGVKGVLKDGCKRGLPAETEDRDKAVRETFGDEEGMGSLVVTDLFSLLFPVRSNHGVFAWITCPLAISRANDLAAISRCDFGHQDFEPAFPEGDVLPQGIHLPGAIIAQGNAVALDELELQSVPNPQIAQLAARLALLTGLGEPQLGSRLCIVHDDIFTFLTEQGTELRTRTALEFLTKKAKDKSLRQEEYVPSYAVFLGHGEIPTEIPKEKFLQVGAEASTGAGLVRWKVTAGSTR